MKCHLPLFTILSFIGEASSILAQQTTPLSQRLIDNGNASLHGSYDQEKLSEGKKSFQKAKRLFFFKKTAVTNANLGLSDYYLIVHDTFASIRILKKIIGNSTTKKIETGDFLHVYPTRKNDWARYHATSKLIEIQAGLDKFELTKRYLKYLEEYCNVT